MTDDSRKRSIENRRPDHKRIAMYVALLRAQVAAYDLRDTSCIRFDVDSWIEQWLSELTPREIELAEKQSARSEARRRT